VGRGDRVVAIAEPVDELGLQRLVGEQWRTVDRAADRVRR